MAGKINVFMQKMANETYQGQVNEFGDMSNLYAGVGLDELC